MRPLLMWETHTPPLSKRPYSHPQMKNPELPENRTAYVASGRAFWHVWIPGLLIALLLAGLMAYVFEIVARAGWHYLFFTPIFMAAPVAGWWYCVQYASRSRAAVLSGVVGMILGLIVYLGRFHAALIMDAGVDFAHRFDVTAEVIWDTMQHQKMRKANDPNPNPPSDVDIAFNWIFLVIMAVVCGVMVGAAGGVGANRPFSERYSEFLKKLAVSLQPGFLLELIEAMREGSTERFRNAILYGMRPKDPPDPAKKKKKGEIDPTAILTVFYLPDEEGLPFHDDPPPEAYLSVSEYDPKQNRAFSIIYWELKPEELAVIDELLIRPRIQNAQISKADRDVRGN